MTTTVADPVFVDSNVLVYANVAEAPLHDVALAKLREYRSAGSELWISQQVLREFLVVRSRPGTFGEPVSADVLSERIAYFRSHFRVASITDPVTSKLVELLKEIGTGGKQVHDANIVATMLVHNVSHLLTHNLDDFRRFTDHITLIPLTP